MSACHHFPRLAMTLRKRVRMWMMTAVSAVISTVPDMPASRHPMSRDRWLVEKRLGAPIVEWVKTRREQGRPWDAIAAEMTFELGLPDYVAPISRQLLQKWCAAAPVGGDRQEEER